ncbi:MAG: hypothetical protein RL026_272 [Pseudomonadota bacterium]|jgi:folate-binding protein YgfZ
MPLPLRRRITMNPYQLVTTAVELPDHAVLAARGPDARRFLQGQLTQDLRRLEPGRNLPAGLLTPQGRVLALLMLQADGPQDVLLIVPCSLAGTVRDTLRRYLLRAKLVLEGPLQDMAVQGRCGPQGPVLEASARQPAVVADQGEVLAAWHEARLSLGWPVLSPASSGHHVAQMLNLDQLGAVAFDKGCYTGQEIVARAHYLGRVKRRLRRFQMPAGSVLPSPGERVDLPAAPGAEVVECMDQGASGVALLAVAAAESASEVDEGDIVRRQGSPEEDRTDAGETGHAVGGPQL